MLGPGKVVGVCCSRSISVFEMILAVLLTGSTYVPVEPEYVTAKLSNNHNI
jgi:non-ribosomal peptide synthetase component F